jgi:hypothetical protein
MMANTSATATELAACQTHLRMIAHRLQECVGQARATAAVIPIANAVHEVQEMERWAARETLTTTSNRATMRDMPAVQYPAIGEEPFNISAGEMEEWW